MPRLLSCAILLAGLCGLAPSGFIGGSFAQALQPVPQAPATASPQARGQALTEARAACRAEADGKSLKGTGRRDAMRDCLRAKFPDSAASQRSRNLDGLTRDGKPTAKAVRADCKAETGTKGLRGPARKEAMAACFKEKRPDLAARADCRRQAKAGGLEGDALKAAVKACPKA